jgi:hypothetical protein
VSHRGPEQINVIARTVAVWLGGWVLISLSGAALGWGAKDDELDRHLDVQRRQLEDPTLGVAQRAVVALEMAATLDRAAQTASSAEERRARWVRAIEILDQFSAAEKKQPRRDEFAFQAAVYVWAQAQSWLQQLELAPQAAEARAKAAGLLDDAIKRLEAMPAGSQAESALLDENRRFRLAEALVDRAQLEAEGSESRLKGLERALGLIKDSFTEPTLGGFAQLLKAEALRLLGRLDMARSAVRAAARLSPPPPPDSLLQEQVAVALARKDFDEATKAIDRSKVEPGLHDLLAVKVHLAKRSGSTDPGERSAAEAEVFRHVEELRKTGKSEARLALLALAQAIAEPGPAQTPEAWDLLAEGFLAQGKSDGASALEAKGAERAEALGRRELAAAMRSRAGAILFQAGKFGQADGLLTRVFDDRQAGSARAKAGMLRILARARGLSQGQPGFTREALVEALTAQLATFPDDPSASEARWLLGKFRLATGERDEALALWKAIPHGEGRWLDARLAIAEFLQTALDDQLLNGDLAEARRRLETARSALAAAQREAKDPADRGELSLALARLELTPRVGQADKARQICEGLLNAAGLPGQRERARRLWVAALAELGQFVDAEREARRGLDEAPASELLLLARLLDQVAAASDSDLARRRYGQLMRTILQPSQDKPTALPPTDRLEARLRLIRGLLYSGNFDAARRALQLWPGENQVVPDPLLDDLADAYLRLEAFPLAVDVYRLRAQQTRPGSIPWFEARYGQSLAYFRAGKPQEARRLIDATAILHPELGGGELRTKFERLRQRLEQE